jgi:hypothetical protein
LFVADQLGLTEHAKELAHWNKPYVYQEYPKVLYFGRSVNGRVELAPPRTVQNAREEQEAKDEGWDPSPDRATEAETKRQEAIGTAAAERAYQDRKLSPQAQAEAAAADQAAGAKHLGEIRERPRRPRPSRAKVKPPAVTP